MKTMRKKCLKQSLSILLTVIFACSMIPTAIAAQLTAEKSEASKIVREITDLREESVKHFLCEDGSYIAATYAVPVHYQENGVWKEIDNSLSLTSRTIDASAKSAYAPKAGSVDVNLPQSFADEQKITARNGEHTLSFGVAAGAKNVSIGKQATVAKVDALPSVVMEEKELTATTNLPDDVVSSKAVHESASVQDYNDEKMAVANQSGAVVYKGIFDDADLEYIVSSNCVKENIVVYAPQKTYTYTFNMDFGDLIPAQQKNGSIWLLESADADEPVFVLETPYMYDADNMDSYAVTMSLKPNGDGYAMTVKADAEWINSAERTFPVVIDPTFTFASSSIDDMYVINGLGAGSQWRNNELRVGRNLTNLARSYVKVALPTTLPQNAVITQATMTLKKGSFFQSLNQNNISIRAYDCDHISNLPYSEITWNYQPFSNSNNGYYSSGATFLSSVSAGKNVENYAFNITDAVRRWIRESDNSNNRYLMLASSDENSKTQIDLHSTRVNSSANRPSMYLVYQTSYVSIDNWSAGATGATSQFVQVLPANLWSASVNTTSQSWLHITNITDSGFNISVDPNQQTYTRTGSITVTFDSNSNNTQTIAITQLGTAPTLILEREDYSLYSTESNIDVGFITNTNWSIISHDPTLTISPLNGSGSSSAQTISINVPANTTNQTEQKHITIQADADVPISKTFTITQFDQLSGIFNEITDGEAELKPADSYNHPLATLSMHLSYAAYNPVLSPLSFVVPGLFMENSMRNIKASDILNNDYGFPSEDIFEGSYNILNKEAAYTFGKREINVAGTTRPLVVVVIRGSVSALDWIRNFVAEFNHGQAFLNQANAIYPVLDSYINPPEGGGLTNPIILVTGHSLGAAVANLLTKKINEVPIANGTLTTATNGSQINSSLYGYTFGTPYVVERDENNQPEPIEYANLFNILNNNDVMTQVPFDFLSGRYWFDNSTAWFRYGISYHITMPMEVRALQLLEVGQLGLGGHAMSTYEHWLVALPEKISMPAESITAQTLESMNDPNATIGAAPRFFKIKCPVNVTLKDEQGTVIGYESSLPNGVYPEIDTDSGIVSWISDADEKMFCIPCGFGSVTAQIDAYDYGFMNVSVGTMGIDEPLAEKDFNSVSLYPEKEFVLETDPSIPIDNVQLFHIAEGGDYIEITDLNPLLKSVTVQNPHVSYGTPTVITVITDKTVAKVQFIDRDTEATITYNKTAAGVISLVEEGDNLIWTIRRVFTTGNPRVYHVRVKLGTVWQERVENAFAIYVT